MAGETMAATAGGGIVNAASSSGNRNTMMSFPPAAHPEIMRAAEKDEQYVSHVCEACYDAFRNMLGTRLAVAYQNETRLAGRVLYYLLTTGAGQQTLGEEYCDISQVGGSSGLPPTPAKRILLVFYHTVLPYLAHRLSSRAADRGISLASQIAQDEVHVLRTGITATTEVGNVSGSGGEAGGGTEEDSRFSGNEQEDMRGSSANLSTSRAAQWMQRVQRTWFTALQCWPLVLPSVREALLLIIRAHLMLFYFEGAYYHLAKRAAGVRYIFMGKPSQQRPRYYMLGLFLLIQLSILGGDWLRRSIIPTLANSMRLHSQDPSFAAAGQRGIAILDEDGKRLDEKVQQVQATAGVSSTGGMETEVVTSKCPLCLSPRQYPTATPCGHVFCWKCIVEWCNEKPECPLCRAPVSHPDMVFRRICEATQLQKMSVTEVHELVLQEGVPVM